MTANLFNDVNVEELVHGWHEKYFGGAQATEICPIQYSQRCNKRTSNCRVVINAGRILDKEARALFDFVQEGREISGRALQLTQDIIDQCEGHYTVWQYRRRLIKGLQIDPVQELLFIRKYTNDRPKNYQLWRHRECIVSALLETQSEPNPMDIKEWRMIFDGEIEDLALVLEDESKNIHAWQYRQWLINTCMPMESADQEKVNLLQRELKYTEQLVMLDVYNNSAWNHRFLILSLFVHLFSKGVSWDEEAQLVWGAILNAPENISIWNYFNGIITKFINLPIKDRLLELLMGEGELYDRYTRIYAVK